MSISFPVRSVLPACGTTKLLTRIRTPERLHHLFFQDLFNLADFLLELACELFTLTFRLQARIVGDLADLLFHFSFSLVKLAFQFVLRTWFHLCSPQNSGDFEYCHTVYPGHADPPAPAPKQAL